MVKPKPSPNSLELDSARIVYDSTTQVMRIVINDKEAGSFALGVQKGGKLESNLYELLIKYGVADRPQPVKEITEKVVIPSYGTIPKLKAGKGNVIAIASPQARTGKSTAAVLLASAIAKTLPKAGGDPYRVCIIDMDLQNGELGTLLGIEDSSAMRIYESGLVNQKTILENLHYEHDLGIYALPTADKKKDVSNYIGEQFYKKTIAELSPLFDVIIVDTASTDIAHANEAIFDESDIILLASKIEMASQYSFKKWVDNYSTRVKKDTSKISVLLTNTPKLQVLSNLEYTLDVLKPLSLISNVPLDSIAISNAKKSNNLNRLFETSNPVAEAFMIVAKRLLS